MAIDSTIGSAADSYISVADVEPYHDARGFNDGLGNWPVLYRGALWR